MDLNSFVELKKICEKTNQQQEKRQEGAENYYALGLFCLEMANKTRFSDKNLARKASELLIQSVQQNRADYRPLVSLGYLMLVFGDTIQAVRYLKQALILKPNDMETLLLLKKAQELAVSVTSKPSANHGDILKQLTILEQTISNTLKEVLALQSSTVTPLILERLFDTCDQVADELELLEQQGVNIKELSHQYDHLADQLETLEQSF